MKKKELLVDIQYLKSLIQSALNRGTITEKQIISLFEHDINEVLNLYSEKKKNLLMQIYLNPYLLSGLKLSDDFSNILPYVLVSKYQVEIDELDYQLENGLIDDNEYTEAKDDLYFLYFESDATLKKGNEKVK